MNRIFLLLFAFVFCSSYNLFCQKNAGKKNMVSPAVMNSFSKSNENDWKEIQDLLNKYGGEYFGVNNKVATSGMPDGPMSGNGNIGIVSACDNNWSRIYITANNFWTGKKFDVKPLPIGGINVIVNGASAEGLSQVQNMAEAEINTTMNAQTVKIKTWLSATGNFLINEISSVNKSPIGITVETWTTNTNNKIYPVANGLVQPNIVWASRETEGGDNINWVCRAALSSKIIGVNYTTALADNNKGVSKFILRPGEKVTVVTAIVSGKDITDHVEKSVAAVKDQTKISIEKLHEAHLNWWKNYWLKSYVRTYDPQLERYYFGALYEAACAYREGNICPALFGPWVTTDFPNWNGNYTLSYNHQASVVGFASSNRPELLFPYIQQRYDWEAEGKKRAQRGDINFITGNRWGDKFKNGSPGILDPITEGPWGSVAEDLYMGMISGSVWASLPICWYYNYTKDEKYLGTTAYPYLKQVANFWETYLVKENNKWVVKYAGDREWYSNEDINSAMDNAVVVSFFKNMINYSNQLGVDADKRPLWQDFVTNMKDLPTGNYLGRDVFFEYDGGSIKEGDWPGLVMIAGHANAITLSSVAEVRQRFINTIDAFNSWETINAPGFLWASAIKGGYPPDALLDRFKYLLSQHMRRNFTIPTGGHGTESISSLDYINSMMLQSDEGFLRLFPGWPGKEAKFVRLRASGAFLVSAKWTEKQIDDVEIYSEKGGKCIVLNPWAEQPVTIRDENKNVISSTIDGGKISFDTKQGSTYFLNPDKKPESVQSKILTDKDVQIGSQIWMNADLNVSNFRNGDAIPEALTEAEWQKAAKEKKPAWCFYENNQANGKLYNWWAVADQRGLAPSGYHIPGDSEWSTLVTGLGGREKAGAKIKSGLLKATIDGSRSGSGAFFGNKINGYYWTNSVIFKDVVANVVISESNTVVYFNYSRMKEGLSVRCIKD
jgi:alpha-L-fucosidase 2